VKVEGIQDNYLGCEILKDSKGFSIGQERIVNDLKNRFEKILLGREFKTPSPNGYTVQRPNLETDSLIGENLQEKFRSGVGSFLYLVKHSRPDIANSVQELSKVMDGALEEHWKKLFRCVKYVELTKKIKLKIHPRNHTKWKIKVFSDSDYCGDKETCRSVSGYVIFV